MADTTTIRVKTNVQKLLRKVAGAMELSMQDAAEVAVRKLAEDNAAWALERKVEEVYQ